MKVVPLCAATLLLASTHGFAHDLVNSSGKAISHNHPELQQVTVQSSTQSLGSMTVNSASTYGRTRPVSHGSPQYGVTRPVSHGSPQYGVSRPVSHGSPQYGVVRPTAHGVTGDMLKKDDR